MESCPSRAAAWRYVDLHAAAGSRDRAEKRREFRVPGTLGHTMLGSTLQGRPPRLPRMEACFNSGAEISSTCRVFIRQLAGNAVTDSKAELLQSVADMVVQIKEEQRYPSLGTAFQHWAAVNVLNLDDEKVSSALCGSMSKDGGIDYFHRNDEGKTVSILQAKFSETMDHRTTRDELASFFSTVRRLDGSDGGSRSFRAQQSKYRQAKKDGFATKLIFMVAGTLTDDNKDEIEVGRQNLPDGVEFECLEARDLAGLIGNPRSPSCALNLVEGENFVSAGEDGPRKMVATIRVEELKKIYENIGEFTLFSLNPRLDLGSSNRIHKKIRGTLKDHPERLWHYNNGISAVCSRFDHDAASHTLRVDNLKIVNGCQTVTTIVSYAQPIDPRATIMLRLSEVEDEFFQKKISTNTNDQNKVRPSDMASDSRELKLLEQKFGGHPRFFLERKKGRYNGLPGPKRREYSPKGLYVINVVQGAKLKLAYKLAVPHQSVQLSEEKIFEDHLAPDSASSPFSDIYRNADPLDFILPKIFYYCLGEIRKAAKTKFEDGAGARSGGKTPPYKDVEALLDLNIGTYQAVAMIGKVIGSMEPRDRDALVAKIVQAADTHNSAEMCGLRSVLEEFMVGVVYCVRSALDLPDKDRPLSEYPVLKQELAQDTAFGALHADRAKGVAVSQQTVDPLERKLTDLFGLCGA